MTEEMRNKRDELAKDYGTSRFPVQNIETRKDFTQDINFARRMIHTEAFQAGFDACYTLMEAENAELKRNVELLREHKKQDGKKIDLLNSRIAYLTGENVHSVELWKQESLKQDEDVCHE